MLRYIMRASLFAVCLSANAHENHHHSTSAPSRPAAEVVVPNPSEKLIFDSINSAYENGIRPIFEKKCMDCHCSTGRQMPPYYNWPIAHQLIDSDIAEAREHLVLENGFPFGGHSTPKEDLTAIRNEIQEGEMPPLLYRLMHKDSLLTNGEKTIVIKWIDESLGKLAP